MSSKFDIENSRGVGFLGLSTRVTIVKDSETGDRFKVNTDDHVHHEDNLKAIGNAIEAGKMTKIK